MSAAHSLTTVISVDPACVTLAGEGASMAPRAAAPRRYVVRSEIARGGMGRISVADDTLLGREVAIRSCSRRIAGWRLGSSASSR